MPSPVTARKTYDVCIVGSGAGGGIAAYALSKAGADVVLMEAGDVWYAVNNQLDVLGPAGIAWRLVARVTRTGPNFRSEARSLSVLTKVCTIQASPSIFDFRAAASG